MIIIILQYQIFWSLSS